MKCNSVLFFIIFLIYLYITTSLIEWTIHYYLMHYNGSLIKILNFFNITPDNSHINHHKETRLDQTLPDNFIEEGLVFNFLDYETVFICVLFISSALLFWRNFPKFKTCFSLQFTIVISFIIAFLYLWTWNSIHSHYHKKYIECNTSLKNSKNVVYSPLRFFIPDESSSLYKYLYWYHTLHHLNKGESKGNYNIICPFFDFIFGTYTRHVDNTLYFSKHDPTNIQEVWLREHPTFDIRVLDNNTIEFKNQNNKWVKFPSNV